MDFELGPVLLAGAIAADKKLRRALIEPSAATLGKFTGAWVDHLASTFLPPHRRNFERHVADARESLGDLAFEGAIQHAAFIEWAEGVAKVDAGDGELAAAWQAALAQMLDGGPQRLRLLKIVKQMEPDEAMAFDRLVRARHVPDKGFPIPPAPLWDWLLDTFTSENKRQARFDEQDYLARFVELGLAQSLAARLRASGGLKLFGTLALVLCGTWGLTHWFWGWDNSFTAAAMEGVLAYGALACAFGAALSLARNLVNPPRLSRQGEALAWRIIGLQPFGASRHRGRKANRSGKAKKN